MMSRVLTKRFHMIEFLSLPSEATPKYTVVPKSWIYNLQVDRRTVVAYPVEHPEITKRRVINLEPTSKSWFLYSAVVVRSSISFQYLHFKCMDANVSSNIDKPEVPPIESKTIYNPPQRKDNRSIQIAQQTNENTLMQLLTQQKSPSTKDEQQVHNEKAVVKMTPVNIGNNYLQETKPSHNMNSMGTRFRESTVPKQDNSNFVCQTPIINHEGPRCVTKCSEAKLHPRATVENTGQVTKTNMDIPNRTFHLLNISDSDMKVNQVSYGKISEFNIVRQYPSYSTNTRLLPSPPKYNSNVSNTISHNACFNENSPNIGVKNTMFTFNAPSTGCTGNINNPQCSAHNFSTLQTRLKHPSNFPHNYENLHTYRQEKSNTQSLDQYTGYQMVSPLALENTPDFQNDSHQAHPLAIRGLTNVPTNYGIDSRAACCYQSSSSDFVNTDMTHNTQNTRNLIDDESTLSADECKDDSSTFTEDRLVIDEQYTAEECDMDTKSPTSNIQNTTSLSDPLSENIQVSTENIIAKVVQDTIKLKHLNTHPSLEVTEQLKQRYLETCKRIADQNEVAHNLGNNTRIKFNSKIKLKENSVLKPALYYLNSTRYNTSTRRMPITWQPKIIEDDITNCENDSGNESCQAKKRIQHNIDAPSTNIIKIPTKNGQNIIIQPIIGTNINAQEAPNKHTAIKENNKVDGKQNISEMEKKPTAAHNKPKITLLKEFEALALQFNCYNKETISKTKNLMTQVQAYINSHQSYSKTINNIINKNETSSTASATTMSKKTESSKQNMVKSTVNENKFKSKSECDDSNKKLGPGYFELPDSYDPNDSKWTLKYRGPGPGLVKLMRNCDIYVNAKELAACKKSADSREMAGKLTWAVFSREALSVCSFSGGKAHAFADLYPRRPGLDKDAKNVMLNYLHEYTKSRKRWQWRETQIYKRITTQITRARTMKKWEMERKCSCPTRNSCKHLQA